MNDLGLIFINKASKLLYLIMVRDRWVGLGLDGKDNKTILSVIGRPLHGGVSGIYQVIFAVRLLQQLGEDSGWMRELDPSLMGLC